MASSLNIELSEIEFEQIGDGTDPAARMLATVEIAGIFHHLEAIAVKTNRSGMQIAQDVAGSEMLSGLGDAFGGEGAFQPVNIGRRHYVLFMSPFCA